MTTSLLQKKKNPLKNVHMILFGKINFADIIKLLISMRLFWIKVGPRGIIYF